MRGPLDTRSAALLDGVDTRAKGVSEGFDASTLTLHAHRFFDRDVRVDPMKLIKLDMFDAEVMEAAFDALAKVRLAAVDLDAPRSRG